MTAASAIRLAELITGATGGAAEAGGSATRQRILDAVVGELTQTPVRKLAVEDVARRAGVSRVTVYRHFGDRDQLLAASTARELSQLLRRVSAADDDQAEPTERIATAFVTAWQASRGHPVLAHWLATDAAGVLDIVLAENSQVLRVGAAYLAGSIRALFAGDAPEDTDAIAELLIRLFMSLLLMPPPGLDPDDPESARRLARELIAPIVVHRLG